MQCCLNRPKKAGRWRDFDIKYSTGSLQFWPECDAVFISSLDVLNLCPFVNAYTIFTSAGAVCNAFTTLATPIWSILTFTVGWGTSISKKS
jgi:hypothetical protein